LTLPPPTPQGEIKLGKHLTEEHKRILIRKPNSEVKDRIDDITKISVG